MNTGAGVTGAVGQWLLALWTLTPGWVIGTAVILVAIQFATNKICRTIRAAFGPSLRIELYRQSDQISESVVSEIFRKLITDGAIRRTVSTAIKQPD